MKPPPGGFILKQTQLLDKVYIVLYYKIITGLNVDFITAGFGNSTSLNSHDFFPKTQDRYSYSPTNIGISAVLRS
jgi:hypothetical protein